MGAAERPDASLSKGSNDYTLGNGRGHPHRLGAQVIDDEYTFLDSPHLTNKTAPTVEHICVIHIMCVAIAIGTSNQDFFLFLLEVSFLRTNMHTILYLKEEDA